MNDKISGRVWDALLKLQREYPHSFAVFSGAALAEDYARNGDLDKFSKSMLDCMINAVRFHWHESAADAARRFCHLCLVDPALMEVHLGTRLDILGTKISERLK